MGYIYQEGDHHHLLIGEKRKRMVVWKKRTVDKFVPYINPTADLTQVLFCSDFDYYAAAPGFPVDKTIPHPARAADPGTLYGTVVTYGSVTEADFVLAAHNLGYKPNFAVSVGGIEYPTGCPIQTGADGARRSITFWVDETNIYVRDSARPSIPGLPAISVTYRVTVFRKAGPVAGAPLYSASPARVRLGYGNIDTNERSLREPEGAEITYAIPTAETLRLNNGKVRFCLPDGTVIDVGPLLGPQTFNGNFWGVPAKGMTI